MRSRLSYYSVFLLVGLAVVSAFVFVMNPFNGAPASASPAAQSVSATTSSVATGNSPLIPNGPTTSGPAGSGPQSGGTLEGGHDHHSDDFPGIGSNSTTRTTTTGTIYSQDE
ncbi:MAG TPA: hypothetical protein VND41_01125 [Nitrososphaerales archaeon]|nr:hypothetical protein [Nitrososphaerales archaeon]